MACEKEEEDQFIMRTKIKQKKLLPNKTTKAIKSVMFFIFEIKLPKQKKFKKNY